MRIKKVVKKSLVDSTNNLYIQLFRYTFVGGLAFAVDFCLLYVLTEYAHLHYLESATISFLVGLFVNYLVSKVWVFSESKFKKKGIEFLLFALVGLIGLGLNNLFLWLITTYLSMYYMFSKLIASVIVYLWNFLARKYLIFSTKP